MTDSTSTPNDGDAAADAATGAPDAVGAAPIQAAGTADAAEPALPEAAPDSGADDDAAAPVDDLAAFGTEGAAGAATAATAGAAVPTMPPPSSPTPGWYPTEGGQRYWDGTAWQGGAPAPERASYGEKWKRRYPVVLFVIAVLNLLSLGAWVAAGRKLDLGLSSAANWGVAFGIAIGLLVSAAFWTSIVAVFGGPHVPKEERAAKPLWRKAWLWAPIAVLAAAGVSTQLFQPAADVAPITVASEQQGCQQYLTTFEDAAKNKASVLGAKVYLQPLADASTTTAPQLAADLQPYLDNPTEATLNSSAQAVLTRCVQAGYLTPDEVNAFAQRLQAIGG